MTATVYPGAVWMPGRNAGYRGGADVDGHDDGAFHGGP